jgi:ubiquinone/menaquinone biosynthesis C-methylase UbiE
MTPAAGTIRARVRAGALREPLRACASGEIAPNVALARLLTLAATRQAVETALAAATRRFAAKPAATRIDALTKLWRETPQAWDTVKQVLRAADHGATAGSAAEWAERFNHAVRGSPEAAAALYSLGRRDLLDAAAQSIVDRLRAWGLTGPGRSALDLGCGCGRLLAALSPHLHRVVGADVSDGMLAAARRRSTGLANVSLVRTSGRDLAGFADREFDLVAAVDVFPYLVGCAGDLAQRHFLEACRVLVRGGSLLVLNYSYVHDDPAAAAEATALATSAGLQLVRIARNDFDLWDGRTFHFKRPEI